MVKEEEFNDFIAPIVSIVFHPLEDQKNSLKNFTKNTYKANKPTNN
jgi:hypothetical protein